MTNGELFLNALLKPITEATVLGAILGGMFMGLLYARKIKVSFYNGFLFNLAFFSVMYITRRFVDGVTAAGGYVGVFLLYVLFLITSWVTNRLIVQLRRKE